MAKRTAITLPEIIVSAVILALPFGGLLAAFVGARGYVARADRRLTAANLGRAQLNRFYIDVRQDTWDTGNLAVNATTQNLANAVVGNITYGRNYVVSTVNNNGPREYRQVTMNVDYPTVD
ncbi:MAG: type II secretion system protein [Candidatus Omnitrophica bacterium]|nr:type II secretion system protein [Candidatus Omnitrophota bacterium]